MPETKSSGSSSILWGLFGWLRSSPVNLTRRERETGIADSLNKPNTTTSQSYFHEQVTPNEDTVGHMGELREMARHDIIQPIIDLYAEECTQPDVNSGKVLWYECSDGGVEEELNNMLERLRIDDSIYSIAFEIASTGNDYRRILRSRENGIEQLVGIPQTAMRRVWEPTTRKLIGFKWENEEPDEDENAVKLGDKMSLFAPWEFLHFRRLLSSDTEYGVAILGHLWPLYRKIKMALDQMVQYRLHTMPTRNAMMIDTGDMTPLESAEAIMMYQNLLRNSVAINPDVGSLESRFRPPGLDSILYFPKGRDDSTSIEKLEGTNDVPDVFDLDLLFKLLFAGSRVPKAYMGFEENTGIAQASLVSQDIRFARMIRVLRKPMIQGFHRLAEIQLGLKGYNPDQYKIHVEMSKISSLEEELNASVMERQADFANTLVGLCQSLGIPNREIIDLVFREYLHVPRRFVDLAKLASAVEQAFGGQEEDGMGAEGGMPMGGGGFSGGLGGGGMGGMDDMEGLGSELGMDGEQDMPDAAEYPLPEAKGKWHKPKIALVETKKKEMRNLGEVLKRISTRRVKLSETRGTNSKEEKAKQTEDKKKLTEAVWSIRRAVKHSASAQMSARTSLVEDNSNNVKSVMTESIFPKKGLTESECVEELTQLGKKLEGKTGGKEQPLHESVSIANNMRRKKKPRP